MNALKGGGLSDRLLRVRWVWIGLSREMKQEDACYRKQEEEFNERK